jgi:hypothetical protein
LLSVAFQAREDGGHSGFALGFVVVAGGHQPVGELIVYLTTTKKYQDRCTVVVIL